VPQGYHNPFDLPRLKDDPEFSKICEGLWQKVESENVRYEWRSVFQAIVLNERSAWVPRILQAIVNADSIGHLSWLARLIEFDGSLIIFTEPEVTRTFLLRATELGGEEGFKEIRSALYASAGPKTRGYTGGELDKQDDYVESQASKAAAFHQSDTVLGTFYNWIKKAEQETKAWHRTRMAAEATDGE